MSKSIRKQIRKRAAAPKIKKEPKRKGNIEKMTSTGSTLLDLAITGGRVRGGGIPAGVLVEIFGPPSSGKTVLLCEIAGEVMRKKGEVMFKDPEARLDKEFASMFGMKVEQVDYDTPDTVPEVFKPVREWTTKSPGAVNGIFADSLAALSTDAEMDEKDAYGMRRAKEFSEECRKTCRHIKKKNYLMVCSNQVREKIGATEFQEKVSTPGGFAVGFYASLRLRMMGVSKINKEKQIKGKTVRRVIGVTTQIQVYKSSVWSPYRTAPLTILYGYGVDDIRQNLQFVKDFTSNNVYTVGTNKLGKAMDDAIEVVEEKGLEAKLKEQVIDLWEDIEKQFVMHRKKKKR